MRPGIRACTAGACASSDQAERAEWRRFAAATEGILRAPPVGAEGEHADRRPPVLLSSIRRSEAAARPRKGPSPPPSGRDDTR